MDSDLNPANSKNLSEYNSARKVWEGNASESPDEVLEQARKYLKKLPKIVGSGPSTSLILDLNTSEFKGYKGSFEKIFGRPFKEDMNLAELTPYIYPRHNSFMFEHFPAYLNHILSLTPKKRNQVELSVVFKYSRADTYYWLSFKTYKYFSNSIENLGLANVEYTDITNIKSDKYAKFIVYDKEQGYILNETIHINCDTLDCLTQTELTITRLITQGLSDKEISHKQHIAINTVKQHKKHIFSKLGINKSTELVAMAYDCGLVT
jgi:DNA-binding CsgD family transcriptional regulator